MNGDPIASPFIIGNMIKDPAKFWGRERELWDIQVRLQKMHSTSVIGPRRIGKSSLAHYLYLMGNQLLGHDYEFVWLDGQSNHSASVVHFFKAIASSSSLVYSPGDNLTDCLINFEDAVKQHPSRLVIVINEFELLADEEHQKEFGIGFYNTLRFLAEHGNLALVTTSQSSLKDLCKHVLGVSSPFYNIFEELVLRSFSTEEANAFLAHHHDDVTLAPSEIRFIQERVESYQHPLVLQIACDSVFKNRYHDSSKGDLLKEIEQRVNHYLSHQEIRDGRRLERERDKPDSKEISKPIDMLISIMVPVLGIGLLMLEFGLLIRELSTVQTVLLALATAILGFAVLIFAGRSINIIGESTFFKLFSQLIKKIPLLSSFADRVAEFTSGIESDNDLEG